MPHVLIKWEGLEATEAPSENLAELEQSYHNLNLEDTVVVNEGSNIMNEELVASFSREIVGGIGQNERNIGHMAADPTIKEKRKSKRERIPNRKHSLGDA